MSTAMVRLLLQPRPQAAPRLWNCSASLRQSLRRKSIPPLWRRIERLLKAFRTGRRRAGLAIAGPDQRYFP
eukprot:s576_g5.t1